MKVNKFKSTDLNKEVATTQRVGENVKVLLVTFLPGAVKSIYTNTIEKEGKEFIKKRELKIQNHVCTRSTNINEKAVAYMISSEVPYKFDSPIKRGVWYKKTERQRLEWHLDQMSDGNLFKYEIIK